MKRPSNLETLLTSDLIPYVNNSRSHTPEQVNKVAASIQEFGFTNPILVGAHNEIIAGHCRLLAAQKLGIESVPVLRLDYLTDAQRKAYVIADNRLALDATWDEAILKIELAHLDEIGYDVKKTGLEPDELNDLMGALNSLGGSGGGGGSGEEDDEDYLDETDRETRPIITQKGDMYTFGNHFLLCGDSTSTPDVERLMGGGVADMVLIYPPYNVKYVGKTEDALTIQNDSMGDGEFYRFLHSAYSNLLKVTKPGGAIYVFHADSEGANFRTALKHSGFMLKQCLIWVKNVMVMGRQDYHWKHEPILYGWAPGAAHNWQSDRKQTTVLEFDRPTKSEDHPTMKPLEILQYLIKNNSAQGESVIDTFGGSGSTMHACQLIGRICYTMEIDPFYCDAIVRRMQKNFPDLPVLLNGEPF